jgi:hypothetical protein
MLTRRSLFTRLSAIALAPLVKLLPKEEAPTGYWAYLPPGRTRNWTAMPSSPAVSAEELNRLINRIMLKQKMQAEQQRLCRLLNISPIPQEEA